MAIDAVEITIGAAAVIFLTVVLLHIAPLIYDYRFRRREVDVVVIAGKRLLFTIENIDDAYTFNIFNTIVWLRHNPFSVMALPNRIRLRWLAIHTANGTVFLTPENPDIALEELFAKERQ